MNTGQAVCLLRQLRTVTVSQLRSGWVPMIVAVLLSHLISATGLAIAVVIAVIAAIAVSARKYRVRIVERDQ